MTAGTFPFGQPIRPVVQRDRGPKRVFVLGVYASAVHARWCDAQGRQLIRALGVASEPYIFWRGDGLDRIVGSIDVPAAAGRLAPADESLNGPSGRSIDADFLGPLGLRRDDAWLCDLVPHSCMNRDQAAALAKRYEPLVEQLGLPAVDWPLVPDTLTDAARRKEIARELRASRAEVLITLGDQPLKWFAAGLGSKRALRAYGRDSQRYGRLHDIRLGGRSLRLLPLVHPRQAAGLGLHSPFWRALHETWKHQTAREIREAL